MPRTPRNRSRIRTSKPLPKRPPRAGRRSASPWMTRKKRPRARLKNSNNATPRDILLDLHLDGSAMGAPFLAFLARSGAFYLLRFGTFDLRSRAFRSRTGPGRSRESDSARSLGAAFLLPYIKPLHLR